MLSRDSSPTAQNDRAKMTSRSYKYYDFIVAAFITVLLCSNIIGAPKVTVIAGITLGVGNFFFPLSYIFGDVLTEVYGYSKTRRCVWSGFAALFFAAVMSYIIVKAPPAPDWPYQQSYRDVFGVAPRIALASLIGFFAGEFTNSFILAKMKLLTKGKFLWSRTISSTVVGQVVDTAIFYPLAFWGYWTTDVLIAVMIADYLVKVGVEIAMTPVTYRIVNFLKRAEQEDYFDRTTNFNPFYMKDSF